MASPARSTGLASLLTLTLLLAGCSNSGGAANQDKSINVTGLADNANVQGAVSVTAQPPSGATHVAFKLDTQQPVEDLVAPFTFARGGLNQSDHTLLITAYDNTDKAVAQKTIRFTSTGAPATLTLDAPVLTDKILTASAKVATGRAPDQVSFTISQGTPGTAGFKAFDAKSDGDGPYSVEFDITTLAAGDYQLTAQAVNAEHKVEDTEVVNFTKTGSAVNYPGVFSEFGDLNDPTSDPAQHGWTSDTSATGSADTYTWINGTKTTEFPNDVWNATVIHAHNVRNASGPDTRYYIPLGRPVTDSDSFQFWTIFRVAARTNESNEWKVGRFGLIKLNNTIPSEDGQIQAKNNNINSVSFEVEAMWDYPVSTFAMVNVDRKDCQQTSRLDCSRRQSNKVPIDASVDPTSTTSPDANFLTWLYAKCTYTASSRTFQCLFRDDQNNKTLGQTQPITLAADEHFTVDALAIHSSGRPTGQGVNPALDWEVGRADFRLFTPKTAGGW